MKTRYSGSCHCGSIRFRATLDCDEAIVCDCSICTRKGAIVVRVPEDDLTLESPLESMTRYTFNSHVAKHYFCPRCGIHTFHRPRTYPDLWAVNVRCLDRIDIAAIEPRRVFGSELD